ncbi:MAG TPA: threonine ammonia-lyase [Candidatus Limnocylindria bacterium]|nr:threonine ammonia-lyase [Candidatus Limnocylindria bacterium]
MTLVERGLDTRAVREAARRIAPHVRRTPMERSAALSAQGGREVYLKLENLQHTGAFKIRGALNAILQLDPAARAAGVVTASAGNHGQGVAFAARVVGVPACVVLPHGVPLAKLTAIQRTGAETVLTDGGYDDAHLAAATLARERGMTYVHAFDDDEVIAGQGTVALEMLADAELDTLVVPVGGGGLIAGIALAVEGRTPRPRIIGVQSASASAFAESFGAGRVLERPAATIADGIAVRRPAERTLAVVRRVVDDIVTVSDEAIARAIVVLLERHKLLAEGAGAAAVAAVLEANGRVPGGRVGAVVSGGNIDPNLLGKVLQQGLASAGRYLAFRTWLDDRPGMLHELTGILTAERINILHVGIHRLGPYAALGRVGLDVIVDTRDRAHAESILTLIRGRGFPAEEILDTVPDDR